MATDQYADRRQLTFERAEGVEPIPTQLQLKELSQRLRARLWQVVYESMRADTRHSSMGGGGYFGENWKAIFYDHHTLRKNLFADEFSNTPSKIIPDIKLIFNQGSYVDVFGFLQFVLRHRKRPYDFSQAVSWALKEGQAAYRILDNLTIIPIGSDAEYETIRRAIVDLSSNEFQGARQHLHSAGCLLTSGEYASSVRESIHSVESVARSLTGSGQLSGALAQLEKKIVIHSGLKKGFNAIYGYTSDENGIRHPILEGSEPNVSEEDALFMIGACAAFVSYVINKARVAGLLSKGQAA